jgi:glycosyltransferase involved in cell wall biosynthesis
LAPISENSEGSVSEATRLSPTISCVMPCYNCADTLDRSVKSILAQSVQVAEILLVDDCSSDETLRLITLLEQTDPRIVGIRMAENGGPARARNVGWERATGTFVAFLDADDTWHPQKLELQLRLLDRHPELAIVGHLVDVCVNFGVYETFELTDHDLEARSRRISSRSALIRNPWSTPSVLLRRDLAIRFDEDLRAAEDYLLWAQILCTSNKGMCLDLPLARLYKARYGASGLSGNLWEMEKGELQVIRKLHTRGNISFWLRLVLSMYSLVKFLRRKVLTTWSILD